MKASMIGATFAGLLGAFAPAIAQGPRPASQTFSKTSGAGTQRRHEREAVKRKWQAAYYADAPATGVSRQVMRRADRQASKPISPAEYSRRKMSAIRAARRRIQAEGKAT